MLFLIEYYGSLNPTLIENLVAEKLLSTKSPFSSLFALGVLFVYIFASVAPIWTSDADSESDTARRDFISVRDVPEIARSKPVDS